MYPGNVALMSCSCTRALWDTKHYNSVIIPSVKLCVVNLNRLVINQCHIPYIPCIVPHDVRKPI
ncbi:ADM_HP2_G0042350.mRNA.1.CDS.1 [Saccharomyces cerevisiae]|nr:ADM_HP2_G0042350.mRNA.1.CDS.1 [Saccharomyces cerevisiae]CAI6636175.1 ADM_HP2_G0042350.mRNA.1.CDS.1 [Saccharomyces cerevisiae]